MTKYQKVPEVGQQASLSETQRITRPDFIDLPMTGLEGPMEKLVRDARTLLIADGCNEMLALKGGSLLVNPELL